MSHALRLAVHKAQVINLGEKCYRVYSYGGQVTQVAVHVDSVGNRAHWRTTWYLGQPMGLATAAAIAKAAGVES